MFSYLIAALMPFNVRADFQHKEKAARMSRAISYGMGMENVQRL